MINMNSWRMGYQAAAVLAVVVLIIVLVSFPLWRAHGDPLFPHRRRNDMNTNEVRSVAKVKTIRELMRLPGATIIPIVMFFYCSVEVVTFFWTTSYLTDVRGLSPGVAASFMSIVYGAQVAGRVVGGFATLKVPSRLVVRTGMIILIAASIAFVSAPTELLAPALGLLGFALGPNYPLILYEVPSIVGKENSQGIIGLQMAAANISSASIPLLIGVITNFTGFKTFPFFLIALACISFTLKMAQDRIVRNRTVD